MAKKTKKPRSKSERQDTVEQSVNGKVKMIRTYEDVADSEDEFHLNRDKILLEDEHSQRRKRSLEEEDAFLEPSDEEILGYSSDDDHESGDASENDMGDDLEADDIVRRGDSADEDITAANWGSARQAYYDNDDVTTQEEAKAEVEEAIRLQKKKLAKMKPADYGLDEIEWLGEARKDDVDFSKTSAREAHGVVKEVLQPWLPTPDMTEDDCAKVLESWYPEFDYLAREMQELVLVLESLDSEPLHTRSTPLATTKSRALAAYMSTVTMYFALLSSEEGRAMDPDDLHTHDVMDCLVQTRETWLKVRNLEDHVVDLSADVDFTDACSTDTRKRSSNDIDDTEPKRPAKKLRKESETASMPSRKAQRAALHAVTAAENLVRQRHEMEASLASLAQLLPASRSAQKLSITPRPTQGAESANDNDFGEETYLTAASAIEKDKRKKSLRFYTAQITQKASKRQDAGRGAGGDADLPYRERLRDRQARLNAEAEKRGKKLDGYGRGKGANLDDGEDERADTHEDNQSREYGEDDEYYDLVAERSKKRKLEKQESAAAIGVIPPRADGYLVEDTGGKRAIGYTIEKNKGLAPKRKKEVRNPRVKKRMKFEEKKKKLGSMKAVYKGGEGRGGYAGEKTGIKSHLIKSVKL